MEGIEVWFCRGRLVFWGCMSLGGVADGVMYAEFVGIAMDRRPSAQMKCIMANFLESILKV